VKNQSKERCERKLNGKWLEDDISILEEQPLPLSRGHKLWTVGIPQEGANAFNRKC